MFQFNMMRFRRALLIGCAMLLASVTFGSFVSPSVAYARDTVSIGLQLEPPHLDPTSHTAAAIDRVSYSNLYEGLTAYQEDGSIAGKLATGWTFSDDGKYVDFDLRRGVQFHDASSFDAADVVYSLNRIISPDSTNAQKQLFTHLQSVEVLDNFKVRLHLAQPDAFIITNLAWGDAVIVPEGSAADLATNPIGTGPFRYDTWVRGSRLRLVRFDDYWAGPTALRQLDYIFISDPSAAVNALMSGQIEAYPNFPSFENVSYFDNSDDFEVVRGSSEGEVILAMNNAKAPIDNVDFRRAISHAINRQDIIDGALFGYGETIGTHFSPHHVDYVDLRFLLKFQPELSRELIAGSPQWSDRDYKLILPPPSYARRGGEIIAAQLRDVGISVIVENVSWPVWLDQVFKRRDYDFTVISHSEPYDISIYAKPDYYFGYDDVGFQSLADRLSVASDPADQKQIVGAMQKLIAVDYVNAYLFQYPKISIMRRGLQGLWVNDPTPATDMTKAFWQ